MRQTFQGTEDDDNDGDDDDDEYDDDDDGDGDDDDDDDGDGDDDGDDDAKTGHDADNGAEDGKTHDATDEDDGSLQNKQTNQIRTTIITSMPLPFKTPVDSIFASRPDSIEGDTKTHASMTQLRR